MTEHAHTELVDGCYRCELNRDETAELLADPEHYGRVYAEDGGL